MKNNQTVRQFLFASLNLCTLLLFAVGSVKAQLSRAFPASPTPIKEVKEDFTLWYISLFVLVLSLCGAIGWLINTKKEATQTGVKPRNSNAKNGTAKLANAKTGKVKNNFSASNSSGKNGWETKSLDAEKELEWFRKNQRLIGKNTVKPSSKNVVAQAKKSAARGTAAEAAETTTDEAQSETAEKSLPVFSITRLELARPFAPLPLSNDEALMSAIEQTQEEFEEDEEVRDLALRILTVFKTRNSVEALTQIALYDLSSNLRSKAVSVLSDFNHETVFEPILQASADPTREVRAAAARAMSKLTFERADAWARIAETSEEGRMRQAARAAVESGFVQMSFDRLIHSDQKYSYEAFALMALLVKSGETDALFEALDAHKNMNVRRAILHVLKIVGDPLSLETLAALVDEKSLPDELLADAEKVVEANELALV